MKSIECRVEGEGREEGDLGSTRYKSVRAGAQRILLEVRFRLLRGLGRDVQGEGIRSRGSSARGWSCGRGRERGGEVAVIMCRSSCEQLTLSVACGSGVGVVGLIASIVELNEIGSNKRNYAQSKGNNKNNMRLKVQRSITERTPVLLWISSERETFLQKVSVTFDSTMRAKDLPGWTKWALSHGRRHVAAKRCDR